MTEKNSFIFLDFDGVVNTENYQMRLARSNEQRKDKYGPVFDPDTVRRLGRIIKATGAKVCLISSWAYEGEEKMKALWKERDMPGQLFAICCNMPWVKPEINVEYVEPSLDMMIGKGRDVLSFLSHIQGEYSYVILDDVPDFFPEQEAHYVQINPKTGITDDDAIRAIHILSSKYSVKCLNSPESFKNELEDSFGEDYKKVQGTMLDDDEDLEEKERLLELKEASRLYEELMEEMSDEETDDDDYGISVEDLDFDDFDYDDYWGDLDECEDEDEVDETDQEILESFMEDTSDEIFHNGNYSKTSPYSEQDD